MIRLLGIDPSLSNLGWGIIDYKDNKIIYRDSGRIQTKSSVQLYLRLSNIVDIMEKIISKYNPSMVAMEETFVNMNALSSLKLAYVRGAIMSLIGSRNLPFREYSPNKIKKTVVGAGHANKEQVKHMIKILISNISKNISLDEADALSVAYTDCMNINSRYKLK